MRFFLRFLLQLQNRQRLPWIILRLAGSHVQQVRDFHLHFHSKHNSFVIRAGSLYFYCVIIVYRSKCYFYILWCNASCGLGQTWKFEHFLENSWKLRENALEFHSPRETKGTKYLVLRFSVITNRIELSQYCQNIVIIMYFKCTLIIFSLRKKRKQASLAI